MSDQQKCQRPGCEGSYEDMGGGELYCGVCGLAPVVSLVGSPSAGLGPEPEHGMVSSPPTGLTRADRGSASAHSGTGSLSPASARSSARSSASRTSVPGRLSRSLSGRTSGRSVSVRSSGGSAGSSARSRLGAGLVTIPDVPRPDPRSAVMEHPEVPERKRFCSRSDCGAQVGRSRGERPGRTEGFCTKCGHPYSFVPKLTTGDIVHGQYEVMGCLAHGGLGWVYLAVDRAVSDRWVVLKGLLDTGDQDAMAAAISEKRFLAEIEHSNIVRIYNFVEHLDQRTGSMDGYIVMEYVGGKSLKEIANERRSSSGRRDPLPVEQACAYGIEALEALGHLHSRNVLYCDFKVDNAIQQHDQLKLIDMGAVRRMDDDESAIYGTVGYQAPEVAEVGPSVASDLYTVARTLAVLTFDFQGYTNVFVDSLPDPDNIGVFRTYESFYRLLVRATDPDPARRFASAAEMAEQLTGVLREVVSVQTGRPRPALSTLFGPEVRVTDTQLFAEPAGDVSVLGVRAQPARRRPRRGAKRGAAAYNGAAPHQAGPPATESAAGPGQTGPGQAGPHQAGPHQAGPTAAGPSATRPHQAEPSGAGQPATAQSAAGPHQAGPAAAGPRQAGPTMAGPHRTGPGQAGQYQAGPTAAGPSATRPHQAGPFAGGPHRAAPSVTMGTAAGTHGSPYAAAAGPPGGYTASGSGQGPAMAAGTAGPGAVAPAQVYGPAGIPAQRPEQVPDQVPAQAAQAPGRPFLAALDARTTALALPIPRIDPNDPNAGFLAGLLASAPTELIAALDTAPGDSLERSLRRVRAWLDHQDTYTAVESLQELTARHPDDWRVVWYRGLTSLITGDHEGAALAFDAIYDAFPGEPAPKLALGVCAEVLGQLDNATEYYRLVWATDPSFVSAAFGLARVQLAAGDREGAVRTLESVPEASIHYTAARVAGVRARLRRRVATDALLDDLRAAADQVTALQGFGLDAVRRERLTTEVLGTALDWVLSGGRGGQVVQSTTLLGSPLDERGLRFGLERSFRVLARLAQQGEERIDLVERANRLRPRTWV